MYNVAGFDSHPNTECSSAGICNRKRGECECFEGYTGAACQRKTCKDDCNGRGVYCHSASSLHITCTVI